MSQRISIPAGQKIQLKDTHCKSVTEFYIENEIGRGGSCIVYNAAYTQNGVTRHCRLKEFYPADSRNYCYDIQRSENSLLFVQEHSAEAFNIKKAGFTEGMKKQISFYESVSGTRNQSAYIGGIFEGGDTIYYTMPCDEGTSYDLTEDKTLTDILKTARSIAQAVQKYHNYTIDGKKDPVLHLDLKPANVFILSETRELIKLFDFDSVIFKSELEKTDLSFSGSLGYMPYELQHGDTGLISEKTDIYSIGAIVFSRIFGRTVTDADKKRGNAIFDVKSPLFENVSPAVFDKLNDFFKKTCLGRILQRYSSCEELISALDKLIEYAQPIKYFLKKNLPASISTFVGRDEELVKIDRALNAANYVFLSAMGGMGKSELAVKFANEAEKRGKYKCFFTTYQGTMRDTVLNLDFQNFTEYCTLKEINTDDTDKLFEAKLELLGKYGNTALLIIDNMDIASEEVSTAVNEPAFSKIVSCGVKLVITTRSTFAEGNLPVGVLNDNELLQLIDHNQENIETVKEIIKTVGCHTLTVDLIGKTIRESFGTVTAQQVLELLKTNDIDNAALGEVVSVKSRFLGEGYEFNAILYGHIKRLFTFAHLSDNEKECLQNAALPGSGSVNAELFLKYKGAESITVIKNLAKKGWLNTDGNLHSISMHPIIRLLVFKELSFSGQNAFANNLLCALKSFNMTKKAEIVPLMSVANDIADNGFLNCLQRTDLYSAIAKKSSLLIRFQFDWGNEDAFDGFEKFKHTQALWANIKKSEQLLCVHEPADYERLIDLYITASHLANKTALHADTLADKNSYISRALELLKKISPSDRITRAKIHVCIGDGFFKASEDGEFFITDYEAKAESAITNYKKALTILRQSKTSDKFLSAYANLQISRVYMKGLYSVHSPLKKRDKIIVKYLSASLRLQKEILPPAHYLMHRSICSLTTYLDDKKAQKHIPKIISHFEAFSEDKRIAALICDCYQKLCNAYKNTNQFGKALECKHRFMDYFEHGKYTPMQKHYDELGMLCELTGDIKNAVKYYRLSIKEYSADKEKEFYTDGINCLDMSHFPQFCHSWSISERINLQRQYTPEKYKF